MTLENFGRNIRFGPQHLLVPTDKNAVLACLEQHRGHKIRALGSLHSWSEAAVCQDVVVDLRNLHNVAVRTGDDGTVYAEIEAGCTIDRALDYLRSHGGYTLPTYGIVGKQTMAGAIAVATHGAGRASLSHYVSAIAVAAYDPETGRARTYEWYGGEELRAARCGLGCTGIVLWIRVRVEPDCLIEEQTQWCERIDQVLDCARSHARPQFYLIPWSWRWYVQLRRPSTSGSTAPGVMARLHRIFRLAGVDVMLNGAVRLLSGKLGWWGAIRWLYRRVFPLIAQSGMHVTDLSRKILTMRHDLYRHVEMELFVPSQHLTHAASFLEWVLRSSGGESAPLPAALAVDNFGRDVVGGVEPLRGSYVHDYPITFRQVLRDDTLISMTSGDDADAWYAISLITYRRDLVPFDRIARFIAATMASAYRARPHWGKICPLETQEIAALYPALPQFRAFCASVDPQQVFVNDFVRRALGFERAI